MTNDPLLITNTKVIADISDHDMVLTDADLKPMRLSQPPRHIFQFSKANKENLLAELSSLRDSFFTTNLQYLPELFINSYNRVQGK